MSKKNTFHFNIQSFCGDPTTIKFFFLQLEDYIKINNLNDNQAIATFRSLLSGNALRYFIEEPSLNNLKTLDEIKEKFLAFFKDEETPSIFALNEIMLKPNETIRSLSHRLNTTFTKVYPSIIDPIAIDTLKYTHLMNALPSDIKMNLLKENIREYNLAVNRAQELQNINTSLNSQFGQQNSLKLSEEISALKEQLNVLTNKHKKDESETRRKHFNRKQPYSSNNRFNNNRGTYNNKFCAFCGRHGHLMKQCYEFINFSQMNHNRDRTFINRNRKNYSNRNNNNNYSRTFPNPNATPFNPPNLN